MKFELLKKIEAKLYFLDRNIMSFIREYNELKDVIKMRDDKKEIIYRLKMEDIKWNQFTPLPSIIEGAKIGQENDIKEIQDNFNIEIQALKNSSIMLTSLVLA